MTSLRCLISQFRTCIVFLIKRGCIFNKISYYLLGPWQWDQSQDTNFIPSVPQDILRKYMKMVIISFSVFYQQFLELKITATIMINRMIINDKRDKKFLNIFYVKDICCFCVALTRCLPSNFYMSYMYATIEFSLS